VVTVKCSAGPLDDPARSLLEIMAVSAGGWTKEAAAQVVGLEEDRAIELSEALARHSLIQLVREACRHVLPVGPAAGLALLGDVPKVSGPRGHVPVPGPRGRHRRPRKCQCPLGLGQLLATAIVICFPSAPARTPLSLMKPSAWWRLSASTALG
jgi:hypothetical protein